MYKRLFWGLFMAWGIVQGVIEAEGRLNKKLTPTWLAKWRMLG
jgi:hypothetical protein